MMNQIWIETRIKNQKNNKDRESLLILQFNLRKFNTYLDNIITSGRTTYEEYPTLSPLFEQAMFSLTALNEETRNNLDLFYEKYLKIKEKLILKVYIPHDGILSSVYFLPEDFLVDLKNIRGSVISLLQKLRTH